MRPHRAISRLGGATLRRRDCRDANGFLACGRCRFESGRGLLFCRSLRPNNEASTKDCPRLQGRV